MLVSGTEDGLDGVTEVELVVGTGFELVSGS